ncbi:hypothetical protein GCM10023065_06390 [Microbacterium laevaniformans]|nr:hypothetical protein GCM10017578_06400 [Microbacterium laevaniformans]
MAIGSQWMALPRDCAQEAVASVRTQQREWFLDSFAPDEIAFQTFIYNSRWAAETEFRKLEPRVASVSEIPNFHIVDANLTGRIDWAMALQPPERAFFARKFDSSRDADLLSEIDRRVE